MIQRKQTIWFLLAAICALVTLKLSFYSGVLLDNTYANMDGQFKTYITIVTVVSATIALINIFLFRNRSLQMKIGFAGLAVSILNIVIYFLELKNFISGTFDLWCVFSFLVPIFYILALRGIRKDQKLIKSLDRLR